MKAILAAVLCAALAGGCLLPLGCSSLRDNYKQVTDKYGQIQTILTNLKPAIPGVPVDDAPIQLPVVGEHGPGQRVLSPDGADEWMQYADGFWHKVGREAGFVACLDRYSLPGWGLLLENAGGRNCGRAAITGVLCRVLSTSDIFRSAETGAPVTIPDKVRWTVLLSDGARIEFEHRHVNDCLAGHAVVTDAAGVKAGHAANGYNCGGKRCFDTVTDAQGKQWQVGIRMVAPDAPLVRGRQ
jgi:hypothetical protein